MRPCHLASLALVVALAATPLAAWAADKTSTREIEESAAGEEAGGHLGAEAVPTRTLAERIPSVTRRTFVKRGRVELYPTVGLSLNDPFYDHIIGSFGISYHLFESLSIGVAGDYYASLSTKVPVEGRLGNPSITINRPLYGGRLEVGFAPFYGKISLLAEDVLHFDIYALAGGGIVGRKEGGTTFSGVVGVGEHFFYNEWVAFRLELRDQMFMMGRNNNNPKNESLQSLLTVVLGVSFFVPPNFEHERL